MAKKSNLKKLIEDYLKKAKLMQVATVKGSQPWACSVYFAFDKDFNFYWISLPSRRHSKEIRNNSKVAGTIVLPHTPGDKVRGIQFQGVAKELTNKDKVKKAMENYAKRFNMPKSRVEKVIADTDGHRCYVITPNLIVLIDEKNFPRNMIQEYSP